jgi:hypothetical protein
VSKDRARGREVRQAESRARQEAADRRTARTARRRALRSRLRPRRGNVGRLRTGRGRAQLAGIALAMTTLFVIVWYLVDSWPVRIAVAVLALVALPAVVTLALDRSTR